MTFKVTSLEFSDRNIVPYITYRYCITNIFLSSSKLQNSVEDF